MNISKVLARRFDDREQTLAARDCLLYALGVGMGSDGLAAAELPFCYEGNLRVLPSMVNVLGDHGTWYLDPALGIDGVRVLHGEQAFRLDRPLRAGATYLSSSRIVGVSDRGPALGAILRFEKTLREREGTPVATVLSTWMLRGDGGCGTAGVASPARSTWQPPDREPDAVLRLPISVRAALLYRLSGDYNPLHADPAVARAAGFERPILHGLCTMGMATRAVLAAFADFAPERLAGLGLRFTAPVYPGETLEVQLWRDARAVRFRARAIERDAWVLGQGHAELRD